MTAVVSVHTCRGWEPTEKPFYTVNHLVATVLARKKVVKSAVILREDADVISQIVKRLRAYHAIYEYLTNKSKLGRCI